MAGRNQPRNVDHPCINPSPRAPSGPRILPGPRLRSIRVEVAIIPPKNIVEGIRSHHQGAPALQELSGIFSIGQLPVPGDHQPDLRPGRPGVQKE